MCLEHSVHANSELPARGEGLSDGAYAHDREKSFIARETIDGHAARN